MQSKDVEKTQQAIYWHEGDTPPAWGPEAISLLAGQIRQPLFIVRDRTTRTLGLAIHGSIAGAAPATAPQIECIGQLPLMYPEWL